MDEKEVMGPVMPEHAMSEEVEPVDHTAPYRAARKQREESAATLAEHDELIADMLYEMTMKEMEG